MIYDFLNPSLIHHTCRITAVIPFSHFLHLLQTEQQQQQIDLKKPKMQPRNIDGLLSGSRTMTHPSQTVCLTVGSQLPNQL